MKTLLVYFLLISSNVFSGHERGNGGDEIRMKFIEIGQQVLIDYEFQLKMVLGPTRYNQMKMNNSVENIQLNTSALFDNYSSQVSAIENDGIITLYVGEKDPELSWSNIINSSRANKLVLHELIRSSGLNDDNYIYSSQIIKSNIQKKSFNEFDVSLKEGLNLFTNKQLKTKGKKEIVSSSLDNCGEVREYTLGMNMNLNCSGLENYFICDLEDALYQKQLLRFSIEKTTQIMSLINTDFHQIYAECKLKENHYQSCKSGERKMIKTVNCGFIL